MRILVIGIGFIGRKHIDILKKIEGLELAICNNNAETLSQVSQELNINEKYSDYKVALKKNFEGVIICTPNSSHLPISIEAFNAGCNVFVEKPISHNLEEAIKILDASKRANKVLMVGYVLRLLPSIGDIKKLIDNDAVGKIAFTRVKVSAPQTLRNASSKYRFLCEQGGGIIYDYSHEIDYLRFLFGDVYKCTAFKDVLIKSESTCEDIAEIIIQYKNKVIANIHLDYIQESRDRGVRSIEIVGSKGVIEYDFTKILTVKEFTGGVVTKKYEIGLEEAYTLQLKKFIKLCRGELTDYISGEDAIEVLKVCEGIYEAEKRNIISYLK